MLHKWPQIVSGPDRLYQWLGAQHRHDPLHIVGQDMELISVFTLVRRFIRT